MIQSFLQAFLSFILDIFFWICRTIVGVVLSPLLALIWATFPDFGDFLFNATFMNRVFNGIGFAKEVFLNLTTFPRTFFYALVIFFFARWTLTGSIRIFRFIINIYKTAKKGG